MILRCKKSSKLSRWTDTMILKRYFANYPLCCYLCDTLRIVLVIFAHPVQCCLDIFIDNCQQALGQYSVNVLLHSVYTFTFQSTIWFLFEFRFFVYSMPLFNLFIHMNMHNPNWIVCNTWITYEKRHLTQHCLPQLFLDVLFF